MRKLLLLFLLLAPDAFARSRWLVFTATAYSVRGTTAAGTTPREAHTVAADPDFLPIGTKIQVRGAGAYSGVYTVLDTGRKIAARHIDIFIADPAEAKQFGKKPVKVRVIKRAAI